MEDTVAQMVNRVVQKACLKQLQGFEGNLECLTYSLENKGDLKAFPCDSTGQPLYFTYALLLVFGSV